MSHFYVNEPNEEERADFQADWRACPAGLFAIREGESYVRPDYVVTLQELLQLRAAIDQAIAERCLKGRS